MIKWRNELPDHTRRRRNRWIPEYRGTVGGDAMVRVYMRDNTTAVEPTHELHLLYGDDWECTKVGSERDMFREADGYRDSIKRGIMDARKVRVVTRRKVAKGANR